MAIEYSRDPSDYRPDPSGHFRRRRREREIPGTAIERCIRGGEATVQSERNPQRVAFVNDYLNESYTVVVNPRKGFAVTVFAGLPGEKDDTRA